MTKHDTQDRKVSLRELFAYVTLVALTLGLLVRYEYSTAIAGVMVPFAMGALIGAALAWVIGGRSYVLWGATAGAVSLFGLLLIVSSILHFMYVT